MSKPIKIPGSTKCKNHHHKCLNIYRWHAAAKCGTLNKQFGDNIIYNTYDDVDVNHHSDDRDHQYGANHMPDELNPCYLDNFDIDVFDSDRQIDVK